MPMRSRRARIARLTTQLQSQAHRTRKSYTGSNPMTGEEWKRARLRFQYTQAGFGEVFDTHWNTVARRERDEAVFAHPNMARLAIEQHANDLRAGRRDVPEQMLISGAEWRIYREGLEMSPAEFGEALDAHVSTVIDWEGDVTQFPHAGLARLAIRRLYNLKGIPFPILKIKLFRLM